MEFYVDIADLNAVKKVAAYYPISGFTTNPKILTKAERPVTELMSEYRDYVEEKNLKIFFQVTGETAEEMFQQASALHDYFGNHFIVKIPAVKEGYQAVRLCKEAGIPVLVTVVHSMMQALMAAQAGADYVAPYVSHIDNIGADGIRCIEHMLQAFRQAGLNCKVLGASFRTVDQLERLAVIGCQAVTITPEMFDMLIAHPSTTESMADFRSAWKKTFGDQQISDLLPR